MNTIARLLLLALTVIVARGDVPLLPPAGPRVTMRIQQDGIGAGGPVLEIPAKLLRTSHAALIDIAPPLPVPRSGGMRMLLAGVLLSAAIVLLGRSFWKRRERKRSQQNLQSAQAGKMGRATQLMLAVAALLSAGALAKIAFADNTRFDPGNLNLASANGSLEGQAAVRITDSDVVILHLTPPRQPRNRPQHP